MSEIDGAEPSNEIRVVAAVVRRGNCLLVCERPPHKRHGGLWEFPGGKCEPGESDADAVRRELEEELGIRAQEVGEAMFTAADQNSEFVIAFLPTTFSGEPLPIEHSAILWATIEELQKMKLAPTDKLFVQFLKTSE